MTAWEDMEPCPCGRPELGRHEKYQALWICRAGYLEKEIGYALSELERGGGWPAAGKRRLERLIAAIPRDDPPAGRLLVIPQGTAMVPRKIRRRYDRQAGRHRGSC
jgi:hypothetical protein